MTENYLTIIILGLTMMTVTGRGIVTGIVRGSENESVNENPPPEVENQRERGIVNEIGRGGKSEQSRPIGLLLGINLM